MNWPWLKRANGLPLRGCSLAVLGTLLVGASNLDAQTIRPVLSEHRVKAQGRVELINPTLRPVDVVVDARSFTVDDRGELTDRPLDASIHVQLSAMSLRIPPQQGRFVFYKATADQLPAWFVLYAAFKRQASAETKGIEVQVELPHVVYLLPKQGVEASDIQVTVAEGRGQGGDIVLDVWNRGAAFGRVLSTELRGQGHTSSGPSFPIFPGGHRLVEVPWSSSVPPRTVVMKARDFKVDQRLAFNAPE
jgi:hypothetical protein